MFLLVGWKCFYFVELFLDGLSSGVFLLKRGSINVDQLKMDQCEGWLQKYEISWKSFCKLLKGLVYRRSRAVSEMAFDGFYVSDYLVKYTSYRLAVFDTFQKQWEEEQSESFD